MTDTSSRPAAGHRPSASTNDGPEAQPRWRRIAFRFAAVVAFAWLALNLVFGLTEVVIMWLPAETLNTEIGGDLEQPLSAHRSMYLAIGLGAWLLIAALAAQLRRPERRVASLPVALAPAVATMFIYPPQGRVGEWLLTDVLVALVLVTMVVLHPRAGALLGRPGFDRPMAALAAPVAVAWVVVAALALVEQFGGATSEHVELSQWSSYAMFAWLIAIATLAGATTYDGWRLPAWSASIAATLFGIHALVFPGNAGTPALPLAVVLIVWAIGYATLILRRGRGRA